MEKIINAIPKENTWTQLNGETYQQGLTLKWSCSRKKWHCGYGGGGSRFKDANKNRQYVEADDPLEALAFFNELLEKNSKKKQI